MNHDPHRRDPLSGRARRYIHVPTCAMVADGLTKTGVFPQLMYLVTTGNLKLEYPNPKVITVRTSATRLEYTEQDLESLAE